MNVNSNKYPWWRKDIKGWPIELFIDRPFKNFIRIICQNIRKPWDYFIRWKNRGKLGKFDSFRFPIIRKHNYAHLADELISVQPMNAPSSKMFLYLSMNEKNPVIGQVFHHEDKFPHKHDGVCMCCLRGPSWSKIWTPDGWMFEKGNEEKYKEAFDKYNPPYIAAEKERYEKMCKGEN